MKIKDLSIFFFFCPVYGVFDAIRFDELVESAANKLIDNVRSLDAGPSKESSLVGYPLWFGAVILAQYFGFDSQNLSELFTYRYPGSSCSSSLAELESPPFFFDLSKRSFEEIKEIFQYCKMFTDSEDLYRFIGAGISRELARVSKKRKSSIFDGPMLRSEEKIPEKIDLFGSLQIARLAVFYSLLSTINLIMRHRILFTVLPGLIYPTLPIQDLVGLRFSTFSRASTFVQGSPLRVDARINSLFLQANSHLLHSTIFNADFRFYLHNLGCQSYQNCQTCLEFKYLHFDFIAQIYENQRLEKLNFEKQDLVPEGLMVAPHKSYKSCFYLCK